MTRSEKKAVIESMAEKFMNIDDLEGKSMTIMVMSAYAEGKAAGKAEERRRCPLCSPCSICRCSHRILAGNRTADSR